MAFVVGSGGGISSHGALSDLGADDHTQYALLAGRSGGQSLYGSDTTGEDINLYGNSVASNGSIRVRNNQINYSSIIFATDGAGDIGNASDNRPGIVRVLTSIVLNSLTASRAMVSDGSKGLTSSATTATELGYVSGVTSALQTQLAAKMDEIVSVDNTVPRFNGTGGAVQSSSVTIDDSDNVTGVADLTATGTIDADLLTTNSSSTNTGLVLTNDATGYPGIAFDRDDAGVETNPLGFLNFKRQTVTYGIIGALIGPSSGGVLDFRVNNSSGSMTQRWQIRDTGELRPFADNTVDIGNASNRVRDIFMSNDLTVGNDIIVATDALVVDAGNKRIGIGKVPTIPLDVVGNAKVLGTMTVSSTFTVQGAYHSLQNTETQAVSAAHTIDLLNSNSFLWDLQGATGTVVLTLSNPLDGASYRISIIQSSSAVDITWPNTVLWPGGVAPVISTGNDAIDHITLHWNGTNYLGQFNQAYA